MSNDFYPVLRLNARLYLGCSRTFLQNQDPIATRKREVFPNRGELFWKWIASFVREKRKGETTIVLQCDVVLALFKDMKNGFTFWVETLQSFERLEQPTSIRGSRSAKTSKTEVA